MTEIQVLEAMADSHAAAERILRDRIARMARQLTPGTSLEVVASIRQEHPLLGPRQIQVIEQLSEAGEEGTDTGVMSRAIGYDQPNVYLTVNNLVKMGFAEKDESKHPHRYRLARRFLGQ